MSGVKRCKDFLRSLTQEEQKKIRVKIKRPNIPESENHTPIYRALDDPKNLIIHFKKESLRGIFDREDIVLNQEFDEDASKKTSRRSCSSEDYRREEKSRHVSYYRDSTSRHRGERGRSYRSRSQSADRSRKNRSRSGSFRRQSRSPRKDKYDKHSYRYERKRSRSYSPRPQPKKKPGLFIPTESDYLKYEKRKAQRSRSPIESHSSKKADEHCRRLSRERSRRRSRTPSRARRSSSGSPRPRRSRRSRSRSRHHDREIEEVGMYGNPKMTPYMFQDGKYWIPVAPTFIPRGFIPAPMYPPRFPLPFMMNRMPNTMHPFRQRMPRPRQQSSAPEASQTSTVTISEVAENDQSKPQEC